MAFHWNTTTNKNHLVNDMNKLYYFTILIVFNAFFYCTAVSQKIDIGLKGGVNLSSLDGVFLFEQENIELNLNPNIALRFTVGGVLRYNVTSNFSVQTELMVASRGARFKEDITIRTQQFRLSGNVNLSYIEVPLLFRLSTVRPDRGRFFYPRPGFTFNGYAGGAVGYKTKANFNGSLTGELFGVPFEEPFKNSVWNQFDTLDYGIIIGGGFEFGINTRIILDLRYYYGLADINIDQQVQESIKNRMFSVLIGFMI
jgi:hypothetical protein